MCYFDWLLPAPGIPIYGPDSHQPGNAGVCCLVSLHAGHFQDLLEQGQDQREKGMHVGGLLFFDGLKVPIHRISLLS